MPSQSASAADYDSLAQLADTAQSTMLLTLIVPILFTMFMSLSMDRVWGLYNMLQVQSNNINFKNLLLTANTQYILFIFKNVSFFNVMQQADV